MAKRSADLGDSVPETLKQGNRPVTSTQDSDVGPFEDDYEDEFESEDEIMVAGEDGLPDDDEDENGEAGHAEEDKMDVDQQTFIPGRHKLDPGQVLAPDLSTYEMFHSLESPWPCLSFDILRDQLGEGRARKRYPATFYAVAGTQAAQDQEKENEIMVLKLSKLAKMDRPDDDLEDDADDDDEDADPILETRGIKIGTCTNRIRAHQKSPVDPSAPAETFVAAMTESGSVFIFDITPHLTSFDTPGYVLDPANSIPKHVIKTHGNVEGFAIDWSRSAGARRLLTGDTSGKIFLTTQNKDGTWTTDPKAFLGHRGSVEEIQWSPSEPTVFASASSDGTIKVWDLRSKAHKPALSIKASDVDVNVLSWSQKTSHLLASGDDNGVWAVWDLRQWKPQPGGGDLRPTPIASYDFHHEQITCVEWHPNDDSIVAVCAGDNTLTLWDLAVELDDEESQYTADAKDVPPQLLFLHYMDMVKECHWHQQFPGALMATGGAGFGVFKTISV